jgi:hypothetical protein
MAAYCELPPDVDHQAIDVTQAVHGMVNHRLDVGFDGDICSYEAHSIAEFLRELLSSVLATASNYNLGSIDSRRTSSG